MLPFHTCLDINLTLEQKCLSGCITAIDFRFFLLHHLFQPIPLTFTITLHVCIPEAGQLKAGVGSPS